MASSSSDRNLYIAALISCFSSGLLGYSMGFIGGEIVLPSFLSSFHLEHLSAKDLALARSFSVTAWIVGALVGVPAAMPVCSKFGRRLCLQFSAVLYVIGAVLQLFSKNELKLFEVGRLVNGMGTGAATLALPLYLSEIARASERGFLMGVYQIFIQLGALLGFWIAFLCQSTLPDDSMVQWQVPVALQFAGGIVLLLGCAAIPESPLFLASQSNYPAMEKSLAWLRRRPVGDPSLLAERLEMEAATELGEKLKGTSFLSELKKADVRRRLHVGVGLMILQTSIGINSLNYYSPIIFMSAGFTSVRASLFLAGTFGLVKLIASLAFTFKCVRYRGNRFWLILGSAACGVTMLILSYCVKLSPIPDDPNEANPVKFAGIVSVLMVYIFTFAYGVSWGPISWNVCAEIFPLHINSTCCAITTCVQWASVILTAAVTPPLLAILGWGWYAILGGLCFVSLIWAALVVPETRGVGVGPQMDEVFGAETVREEEEVLIEVSETTALLEQHRRRRSSLASYPPPL
ncbi:hypothetical protein LTR37_020679 [Vermiconidia calcicola]|uniref:Uncharacterized protein n=1 Tax=Vermiconidia calcicola TaxID=1690605 RepID=A0ACC3MAL1_9PEZI|nr:hypothetical protein LTR37_020679 [Vermiconidia calcicola]